MSRGRILTESAIDSRENTPCNTAENKNIEVVTLKTVSPQIMSVTCGTEIDRERVVVEQMAKTSEVVLNNLNKTLSKICEPVKEYVADAMAATVFVLGNVDRSMGILKDFFSIPYIATGSDSKCRDTFQEAVEQTASIDLPKSLNDQSNDDNLCYPSPLNIKHVIHERRKCVLHLNEYPTNKTKSCLHKVLQGVVYIKKQIPELEKQTKNLILTTPELKAGIKKLHDDYKHSYEEMIKLAKSTPCSNFTNEILQVLQKHHNKEW